MEEEKVKVDVFMDAFPKVGDIQKEINKLDERRKKLFVLLRTARKLDKESQQRMHCERLITQAESKRGAR